jgi:DMSO/TMAO reductase YedYZ heme-binding membrane subunit
MIYMKYERELIISSLVVVAGIILFFLLQERDIAIRMIVRAAGLFGYLFLSLAIVSSEYMLQMRKVFGRPFMNVHHHLARVGVVLILVHPTLIAYQFGLSAFLPVFYPFMDFLGLAGRPALYLIIIAVLAGVYRKRIPKKWKSIHALNYLGFVLVFFHAWIIGTDLQYSLMQALWIALVLIVLAVFVRKHIVPTPARKKNAGKGKQENKQE